MYLVQVLGLPEVSPRQAWRPGFQAGTPETRQLADHSILTGIASAFKDGENSKI